MFDSQGNHDHHNHNQNQEKQEHHEQAHQNQVVAQSPSDPVGQTLAGTAGNDTLTGGAGNDTLFGGAGDDTLTGGAGNDVFRFAPGTGSDLITDFGTGSDRLIFDRALFFNLEGVRAAATETDGNLEIGLSESETLTLEGASLAAITADTVTTLNANGEDTTSLNPRIADWAHVDGAIAADGEVDMYRLTGVAAGTRVYLFMESELNASNADYPFIDPTLEVKDTGGERIAYNNDYEDSSKWPGLDRVNINGLVGFYDTSSFLSFVYQPGMIIEAESRYSIGPYKLYASTGSLVSLFTGGNSANSLAGTDGSDEINGLAGNDQLAGLAGNDTLTGGAGADTLDGAAGVDTAVYSASSAAVAVNLATGEGSGGEAEGDRLSNIENLTGSAFADSLTGNDGANQLVGLAGNDTLFGGAGNDTLEGGAGADTLDGAAGVDTAVYSASTAAVIVNLATGEGSGGEAEGDRLSSIENLTGSAFADNLTGDDGTNQLAGLAGNDILTGGAGDDVFRVAPGTGSDLITDFGTGSDRLIFEDGLFANLEAVRAAATETSGNLGIELSDTETLTLAGASTAALTVDTVTTLNVEGTDTTSLNPRIADWAHVSGNIQSDQVDMYRLTGVAAGTTVYLYMAGAAVYQGEYEEYPAMDTVLEVRNADGNRVAYNDDLTTNAAAFRGFQAPPDSSEYTSADTNSFLSFVYQPGMVIAASEGNEGEESATNYRLYVSVGIPASDERDLVSGTAAAEAFNGGAGGDNFSGLGGDDTLDGGVGNDSLIGGAGADTLTGGLGNDSLDGGAGADSLDGGDGVDLVEYVNSLDPVAVNLATGEGSGGEAEGDRLTSIENLTGSAFADNLTGDNRANEIIGGAGGDRLNGLGGDDNLGGGLGNDTLTGGTGNDSLTGGAGADSLDGGDGVDTASYIGTLDPVAVNLATGMATGGQAEGDRLTGIENLVGSIGNDSLTGDDGANRLNGSFGDDTLTGGAGDDVFIFLGINFNGSDLITDFGTGSDQLEFTDGLFANLEAVRAAATEVGGNLEIELSDTDTLTLAGVSMDALTADTVITLNEDGVNTTNRPGSVAISGTVTEDEELTATATDANGLPDAADITYQWQRNTGANGDFENIAGATQSTYTLGDADVGQTVRVAVSYTDDNGTAESVTSVATVAVTNVNDVPTGAVTISGTVTEGETLTAQTGTLADDDGLGAFSYQWQRNTGANGGFENIANATARTYTLGDADVGQTVRVAVSYTDDNGTAESVTSVATVAVTNVNDLPSGSVTISGTVSEGETLTAQTNTLADNDGLGALSYQWQRNTGANGGFDDIAGATQSTYTLGDDDVGQTVRVAVRYTDDNGTAESVTSVASAVVTNVNDLPSGSVTISGTVSEGETLTAQNTLADNDGLGALSYQWQRNTGANGGFENIANATARTYTLGDDDVGQTVRVAVSYTDDNGTAESVTSVATVAVTNVNSAPTGVVTISGSVTISGTVSEGETLTAQNTLADNDGLGALSYQWQRSDGSGGFDDIQNATQSTYTLGDADVGQTVRVAVSYTDDNGTPESVTSAATGEVGNVNDLPSGSVTISGTVSEGETLTAQNTLADNDGLGALSYQWQRNTGANGGFENIANATARTYTLGDDDVGQTVRVAVSYTDDNGTAESVTSVATVAVTNVNDLPTGSVTISGTVTEGETLTADISALRDADGLPADASGYSYQWQRGDGSGGFDDIQNATQSTYTLGDADVGRTVQVAVSYRDGNNTAETVTSDATAEVTNTNDMPTGEVTISGTVTEGETLTADISALRDADGLPADAATFTYQWQRGDGSGGFDDIAGATQSTYTLGDDDVGRTVQVQVSYRDGQGTAETVTSVATAAVTNVNDLPTGSVAISGTVTEGETLTADISALRDADGLPADAAGYSYQWQRGDGSGGFDDIAGATGQTYTLGDADVDQTVRVEVSYTDDQGTDESVTSDVTAAVENANVEGAGGAQQGGGVESGDGDVSRPDSGNQNIDGGAQQGGGVESGDGDVSRPDSGNQNIDGGAQQGGGVESGDGDVSRPDSGNQNIDGGAQQGGGVEPGDGDVSRPDSGNQNIDGGAQQGGGVEPGDGDVSRPDSGNQNIDGGAQQGGGVEPGDGDVSRPDSGNQNIDGGAQQGGDNNTDTGTGSTDPGGAVAPQPSPGASVTGTEAANELRSGDGNDTLDGGTGRDTLTGDAGNDILIGDAGDDVLDGGAGNDRLDGGPGADTLDGGTGGNDTAVYSSATEGVAASLATGTGTRGDASGDRFIDIENLQGSGHDDTLTGNDGFNVLSGLGGDDILDGGSGNDILHGGAGDDTLWGSAGADILNGDDGVDTVSYGNSGEGVTISLGVGVGIGTTGDADGDNFRSIENLEGSNHSDMLTGNGEANALAGLGGNDTIDGGAGDDMLMGGDGDDVFRIAPGAGSDTITDFGTGSDRLEFTDGLFANLEAVRSAATETDGNLEITLSQAETETLTLEGASLDALTAETVTILDADVSPPDSGNQNVDGGAQQGGGAEPGDAGGVDTTQPPVDPNTNTDGTGSGAVTPPTPPPVIPDTNAGTDGDEEASGTDSDSDPVDNTGTGGSGTDGIDSTDGTDTTIPPAPPVTGPSTSAGTVGSDVLTGSTGEDFLRGSAGNDQLTGGAGGDRLFGGAGRDNALYRDSGAGVMIDLGSGTASGGDAAGDTLVAIEDLTGSAFDDTLSGNAEANGLSGGSGDDRLNGAGGADLLLGGLGNDVLDGGSGRDALSGDEGDDTLEGGAGVDELLGGPGNDVLRGGDDTDRLFGGAGNTMLSGDGGADVLYGGVGDDTLSGGEGADVLNGLSGSNVLTGGAGSDVFVFFGDRAETRVTDFNPSEDRLSVLAGDAEGLTTGNDESGHLVIEVGETRATLEGVSAIDEISIDYRLESPLQDAAEVNERVDEDGNLVLEVVDTSVVLEGLSSLAGITIGYQQGDADHEVLVGSAGHDVLYGGGGNDVLSGGLSGDLVIGGSGHDVVYGGAAGDLLLGESGDDLLFGEGGADVIRGGAGSDILVGGDGDNVLQGGAGEDMFVVDVGAVGNERIVDFNLLEDSLVFLGLEPVDRGLEGTAVEGGTLLTLSDEHTLLVVGVNPEDLGRMDVVFF